jgi:hypothetical protein
LVGLLLLLALMSCTLRPPHVIALVDDPLRLATGADALLVGKDPEALREVKLGADHTFPSTITLTASEAGLQGVWLQAVDAEGAILALAFVGLTFGDEGETVAVELRAACDARATGANASCDDGLFCNGAETCQAPTPGSALAWCAPGTPPCPPSEHECVARQCVESAGQCTTGVDHSKCVNEGDPESPWLCDVDDGCQPGAPCSDDAECDNGSVCDGLETCTFGKCQSNDAPAVEDGDPCTVDICDVERGVLNLAVPDGSPCKVGDLEGVCGLGECRASVCGDGVLDIIRGEECDDGNSNELDLCRGDCTAVTFEAVREAGGGFCDGAPIAQAAFGRPDHFEVAPDGTLLFVDRVLNLIRRYDPASGALTRVAGTGLRGLSVDGTPALTASLDTPLGVRVHPETGQVWFTERESTFGHLRYVDAAGVLRTVAGAPEGTNAIGYDNQDVDPLQSILKTPTGFDFLDDGSIVVVTYHGERVRRIYDTPEGPLVNTIMGEGGEIVDAAPSRNLKLAPIHDFEQDASGDLWMVHSPSDKAMGNGVSKTTTPTGTAHTNRLAGASEGCDPVVDGTLASDSHLCDPKGIALGALGDAWCVGLYNEHRVVCADSAGVLHLRGGDGGTDTDLMVDDTAPLSIPLPHPRDVATADDGGLWVLGGSYRRYLAKISADGSNIRLHRYASDAMDVCGMGGAARDSAIGHAVGSATSPDGMLTVVGAGQLRVVDSAGMIDERFYVGDAHYSFFDDGRIARAKGDDVYAITINEDGGEDWSFVAGNGPSFADDVPGDQVNFDGIADLFAAGGSIYVLESSGQQIRRLSPSGDVWVVTSVAGNRVPDASSLADGPALEASFHWPVAMGRAPDGSILVAESQTGRIRRVTTDGQLETAAQLGEGLTALAVDAAGNAYVATTSHRIYFLGAGDDGALPPGVEPVHVAGDGQPSLDEGPALTSSLRAPVHLSVTPSGDVLASMGDGQMVVRLSRQPPTP